jgi:hypothetical protein
VYVPGAIVDANDPSMFFDPNGISRTQDIRLTSRGGVALSNLLPNYVHKGAILIRGPGPGNAPHVIPKANCGDGAGYAANRIVITWQSSVNWHAIAGQTWNDSSLRYVDVQSGSTSFGVRLLTYVPSANMFLEDPQNSAIVTIYCYYP